MEEDNQKKSTRKSSLPRTKGTGSSETSTFLIKALEERSEKKRMNKVNNKENIKLTKLEKELNKENLKPLTTLSL